MRFAQFTFLILSLWTVACPTADAARRRPAKKAPISREEYVVRMRAQVDDMANRIRLLAERAPQVDPHKRAGFHLSLRTLWQRERLLRVRLTQIEKAKGKQWVALKREEDAQMIGLNKYYRKVVNAYLR